MRCAARWGRQVCARQLRPCSTASASQGLSRLLRMQRAHQVYRGLLDEKQHGGAAVLTHSRFRRLCEDHGIESKSEADSLLHSLHAAGIVFHLPGDGSDEVGLVWLCTERVHAAARESAGLPPADCLEEQLGETAAARVKEIRAELAALEETKRMGDARTAAWWRSFWAFSALASAAQMSIMAYLTFVYCDEGWDTVEPWTFFVAQATATVWFLWFVRFRQSATNAAADRLLLPAVAQRKYASAGCDYARWQALSAELLALTKGR
eukprot:TRINITY_DN26316_c0_g1_i2.p1 TRINITY_DN26316_c0_g1~~TRINITY_DN26316_c0_g1_i2.p1  ORF type:complete len:284 (+),score=52.15 TRINITY_DN26316_c0_g1_i2:58-852(+)